MLYSLKFSPHIFKNTANWERKKVKFNRHFTNMQCGLVKATTPPWQVVENLNLNNIFWRMISKLQQNYDVKGSSWVIECLHTNVFDEVNNNWQWIMATFLQITCTASKCQSPEWVCIQNPHLLSTARITDRQPFQYHFEAKKRSQFPGRVRVHPEKGWTQVITKGAKLRLHVQKQVLISVQISLAFYVRYLRTFALIFFWLTTFSSTFW